MEASDFSTSFLIGEIAQMGGKRNQLRIANAIDEHNADAVFLFHGDDVVGKQVPTEYAEFLYRADELINAFFEIRGHPLGKKLLEILRPTAVGIAHELGDDTNPHVRFFRAVIARHVAPQGFTCAGQELPIGRNFFPLIIQKACREMTLEVPSQKLSGLSRAIRAQNLDAAIGVFRMLEAIAGAANEQGAGMSELQHTFGGASFTALGF